jgi:hypothetical protein
MSDVNYSLVLWSEYPGTSWSMTSNDYATLTWLSDSPKPTQAALDAAWPAVKASHDKAAVQRARAARYQAETDPLFFKAQRGEDGITIEAWEAAVDQIRAELPYPA